jgi:hypothetical protein
MGSMGKECPARRSGIFVRRSEGRRWRVVNWMYSMCAPHMPASCEVALGSLRTVVGILQVLDRSSAAGAPGD